MLYVPEIRTSGSDVRARGAALRAGGVTTCKQLAGIVDNGNTSANSASAQTALGVISGNLT